MVILIWCLPITLICALEATPISGIGPDEACGSVGRDAIVGNYVKLTKSNRSLPFSINLSSHVYDSESNVLVSIEGPHNSSFILEMRALNSEKRVGKFQMIPHLPRQPVICQGFLTAGPLTSPNVTFRWLGPSSDEGTLALMGFFVSGNEYWVIDGEEEKTRLSYRKPKLPEDGCSTHGDVGGCKELECEYHLFYELNDDKKTVKVKMRGHIARKDVYLGMVITNNMDQDVEADMSIYCIFTETGVKVKSMNEIKSIITGRPKIDSDHEKFHCSFPISLELLNQTVGTPSYLAYFWGNVNPNTGEIIPPRPQSIKESFQPLTLDGKPGNSCYFANSSKCHFSLPTIFITFLVMYTLLPAGINAFSSTSRRQEFVKVAR